VSEDEEPELIAAFAALGGPLSMDELIRLLGSEEYHGALVRLATLLLDGDTALAEAVARDSLAAAQRGWSRPGDPGKARSHLHRMVVNRARSIRRRRAADARGTASAAGHGGTGEMDLQPWVGALRTLGDRQLEAVVLDHCLGLPAERAAEVMSISTGAARSHLARGTSSLRHRPHP
jgi:DNA-directed RNA polymerase specialized sigma24 family protein